MKLLKAQVRNEPLLNGWARTERKNWLPKENEIHARVWLNVWSIVWDELDGYNKTGTMIL